MQSFSDSLHIHLFDEIIVDILEDERMRDTTIHQRLDRNWLGSLRIPFSTLYFNHQVSIVNFNTAMLAFQRKGKNILFNTQFCQSSMDSILKDKINDFYFISAFLLLSLLGLRFLSRSILF